MNRIIKPTRGIRGINWVELVYYRDLLWFLTIRGVKAKYSQSILGISWAIIQPLFTTLMFTIVFGNFARINSGGVPYFLFSYTALVPWTFFANTLNDISNSLVSNAAMINKVYFPRLILPLSSFLSKGIDFIITLILLVFFLVIYQIIPSFEVMWFPWILSVLIMTSLGAGMLLSAMAVQYRDVKHAMTFLIQLLMYGSPVVYSTAEVPTFWQPYYALNPMVGVIEGFRSSVLGVGSFPYQWLYLGTGTSLMLFFGGLFYFRNMERTFADVV